MGFYKLTYLIGAIVLFSACHQSETKETPLIPFPNQINYNSGSFIFSEQTPIVIEEQSLRPGVEVFVEKVEHHGGHPLSIKEGGVVNNAISVSYNHQLNEEEYKLDVQSNGVSIEAANSRGVFYALQTFLQLCPNDILSESDKKKFNYSIANVSIQDNPQFKWRGMMLDVSRHFFTKDEVKEMIDYLAFHKINVFHWHLVDDQGWRIEIKKYPKLTEVGAWRVDREDLPWDSRPPMKPGEKATYGGFYTQEDIKEVVAYAKKRFVTVVPEIEMPGHTTSSLAAYPEYSCTGGPFNVMPGGLWPITDIYCAGNDDTFSFIEDILTEVMALFPSKYIHIGGDEANKAEWEKCSKCQARIKEEKLADEHALQSYFITRVEQFLSANNRTLIGWDEILEGGLAPNATVMSWRGFKGGIEAANSGHNVIMSPTSHCYFDYYQGPIDTEPVAFNGFIPLKKVYEFDPIPAELSEENARFILGGQGNLWTEKVPDKAHMQYMTFPRMAAMAEVLWTSEQSRDWDSFSQRLKAMTLSYDVMGLNYAKSMYTVQFESIFDEKAKTIGLQLFTEMPGTEIYYSTDGSEPSVTANKYDKAIHIDSSVEIKASTFVDGAKVGITSGVNFDIHKATAKSLEYKYSPHDRYKGDSEITLVNSLRGSRNFSDGNWQGFQGNNLEVVIDLNEVKELSKVVTGCLHETGSWIFLPQEIKVQTSLDGKQFVDSGSTINSIPLQSESLVMDFNVDISGTTARYIKVTVVNQGEIPQWHSGSGSPSWLFVDEIIVE
ncbi:glycoside hydrolase family 20 protein [Carboxylicivirga marina]|uniref:beta-N-acetylhexosaminidase n=1 Tax=Carboxylicivirga marina TaxID=2800988 RepID=A0ABS1HKA3_9BACT|nr:glycoside hydrolase family 20 protein [Carboxylicivirga marina]MBK3518095.1 family 20 glycosylhydrolase [Carboxylicivirga marina]